jgi:hypothetical protein
VSSLRRGKHEIPDLQRDWDRDGEENFIWVDVVLRVRQIRANPLEDLLIDTLQTTEPAFGYNRMTVAAGAFTPGYATCLDRMHA